MIVIRFPKLYKIANFMMTFFENMKIRVDMKLKTQPIDMVKKFQKIDKIFHIFDHILFPSFFFLFLENMRL